MIDLKSLFFQSLLQRSESNIVDGEAEELIEDFVGEA